MNWLTSLNARLSRWALYLACLCLASLLVVVVYGVVMRYAFNDAPPYVEQVALLLVISVAMFGASAGVRDAGHIGLDSLVRSLPADFETAGRVTGSTANLYLYDLGLDYYTSLQSRISAITAEQVAAVAKKYIVPGQALVIAVGDRARIGADLEKQNLGPTEVWSADGVPQGPSSRAE